jgi:hypothetical protein
VRLWLDGKRVIDDWTGHPPKANHTGVLEAGRTYEVRLEYFEAGGGATCQFAYLLPDKLTAAVNSARLQLLGPDGKEVLGRRIQWEGQGTEVELELPDLSPGRYTVAAGLPGLEEAVKRHFEVSGTAEGPATKLDVAQGSYAGSFTVAGEAKFTVQPPLVRVQGERYVVEFIDMGISQITDRKTGQQYCQPDGMEPGRNAALYLKTYLPGRPDPTFFHLPAKEEKQQVNVERLQRSVEYTVTGLVCPNEKAARSYLPEARLGLRIEYDDRRGDLVLTVIADAGVPQRFGAYDTGIFAAGFDLGTFRRGSIKLINPSGMPTPVSSFRGWEAWWPTGYPVGLMVFEAPGGECVALWPEDADLRFGRKWRINDGTVQFQTVAGDAPWRVGRMRAPIWRLNLFESWEPAALRYREVMERILGIKKIQQRRPARARLIRTVTHAEAWRVDRLKRYFTDRGVPAKTLMGWETQGWLAGYGRCVLGPKHGLWFPNYPCDHPTHYRGRDGFGRDVRRSQEFGVPVFPYTLMFYGMSQPFEKDTRVLRPPEATFQSAAGRMWWILYGNMMEDLRDRYGLQGIYNDVSWVGPRYDPRGKVDGLTVWQSHVQGRRYMKERLLPTAFMGERQHEVTLVSDFVALLWFMGEKHPINSYLFGPYSWRFNQREANEVGAWLKRGRSDTGRVHSMLDATESLTAIPFVSWENPLARSGRQLIALLKKRMLFWGQQMLTPYFPERYEPGVLAYLRGEDGTEYRTRTGGGMGLVRLRDGEEEILWWRTRNVVQLEARGASIAGWVGYDGDRVIGLNPDRRYVLLEEHKRPPVVITGMPEGPHLSLSRNETGYWVAAVSG